MSLAKLVKLSSEFQTCLGAVSATLALALPLPLKVGVPPLGVSPLGVPALGVLLDARFCPQSCAQRLLQLLEQNQEPSCPPHLLRASCRSSPHPVHT